MPFFVGFWKRYSQGRDCQPIDDVLLWLVINGNIQNEFDKYISNKYSPDPGKNDLD